MTKNFLLAGIALAASLASVSNAAMIVGYDFGSFVDETGTLGPSYEATGVTGNNVSGSGGAADFVLQQTIGDNTGKYLVDNAGTTATWGSTDAGNFSGTANDANATTLAGAITNNHYVTFTVTADSGYTFSLSGLSLAAAIASTTNNRPAEFFNIVAQVDNGTTWDAADALFSTDQEITTIQGLSDWDDFFVDLSSDTTFQDINSVEFRIYIWGGSDGTSSSRTDFDQIVVQGSISPVPELSSSFMAMGLAVTGLMSRRRSKR